MGKRKNANSAKSTKSKKHKYSESGDLSIVLLEKKSPLNVSANVPTGFPVSTQKKFPPNFSEIPIEVIEKIMENLSLYDNMSLSLACTAFHKVFKARLYFHMNKKVVLTNKNHKLICKCFTAETSSRPFFTTVEFHNMKFDKTFVIHEGFWKIYGGNITQIYFEECQFFHSERILRDIFSRCPNLEMFKINFCRDVLIQLNYCSKMKYAKLKCIDSIEFSDYAFNNFIKNAPNLHHFIEIRHNEKFVSEHYIENVLKEIKKDNGKIPSVGLNREFLTCKNVFRVLPKSKIDSFRIRLTSIHELNALCKLKELGFNPQNVSYDFFPFHAPLDHVRRNNDQGLFLFLETYGCGSIDRVVIKRPTFDSFYKFNSSLSVMQNLKDLTLSVAMEFNIFKNIIELKNLKSLTLGGFFAITNGIDRDIYQTNILSELSNLRKLSIHNVDNFMDVFGFYLNDTSTQLEEIRLTSCHNVHLNQFFDAVYNNQKSLRNLVIAYCSQKVKDKHILTNNRRVGISSLKKLRCLELLRASYISDAAIRKEFIWNELTNLNLEANIRMTDDALRSISQNCPALTQLNLTDTKITNEGIKHLRKLDRLRVLKYRNKKVTSDGLKCLKDSTRTVFSDYRTSALQTFLFI